VHRGIVGLAILGAVLLRPAPGAPAQAGPAAPELDVVVRTSLLTTPEHLKAYKAALQKLAEKCFGGLVVPGGREPDATPKDGLARYRLTIEHKGTVAVGSVPEVAKGRGDQYVGVGQLETKQKGEFLFRLGRWSGSAYPAVDTWSSTYGASHFLMVDRDTPPEATAEIRSNALLLAMPDAVTRGILDHILPVRLAGTAGDPGKNQAVKVSVENKSLWPLRKLAVTVTWSDLAQPRRYRYQAELLYEGRLAPGKQAVLVGTGTLLPAEYQWEYDLPAEIKAEPTFEPLGLAAQEGK